MKATSFIFTVTIALVASGCGGMFKGKKAAEQGVADFHKMYNDGKANEIYAASHSKFKNVTKEKEFSDLMGAVQRKLGKVTQTSNGNFNIRSMNLVTTIVLTQNTSFENGSGTETFTFEMDGDKAVLLGYNINSKELVLR